MNQMQFLKQLECMDDRLVQRAQQLPNYALAYRRRRMRRLCAAAAVLVLTIGSFSAGALAFSRETIVEVPAQQEIVTLEELELALILPDEWKERYVVIEDRFVPTASTMWEFCVKSVYEAGQAAEKAGNFPYRGTLFTVFRYADRAMSAEEFQSGDIAGIGRYLFATEDATYAILYATDVQFDPADPAQQAEWNALQQSADEIQLLIGRRFDG